MRNIILTTVLVSSLAFGQSCSNQQSDEQKTEAAEQAAIVENQKEAAAKRAALIKEKEKQRKLARIEKAELSATYEDAAGNIVFYQAEIDPSYTGGLDALNSYLEENLEYPAEAQEKGYEGTVFVDFVIDANGNVRDVVASDAIGEHIDESFKTEAVRVVSAMPGWKAGLQNGNAVAVAFSVPITFQQN